MVAKQQKDLTELGLKKQLKRLKGYNGFDDLKEELYRILWQQACSDEHAERIITEVINLHRPSGNGYVSCPLPSELRDYCHGVPAEKPPSVRDADKNCSLCHGSGFAITERGGISGAEQCRCRRAG